MSNPSVLDTDVFTALRSLLLLILPSGTEVVQTQDNGVPMPAGEFVTMNNVRKVRLETNTDSYVDPGTPNAGSQNILTPWEFTIQLDCYGADAGDWAALIAAVFRDEYGCSNMPSNIQPLYTSDPVQLPLITGEKQYLQRWKVDMAIQYNPVTSVPMSFFSNPGSLTLADVDTFYQ